MKIPKMCELQRALILSIGAKKSNQNLIRWGLAIGLLPLLSLAASAQVTTGGDGTVVNTTGNSFNITGGTTQGANLFHSFGQFGVGATQTANFQPNAGITNILGRVVGREPSVINGSIQVTQPVGSTANINLYLMNPAGIIFGSTATLNVPGSFTATTANAIGFGNNWFNAFGNNNYAALTGNPGDLAFTSAQPGSIFNAANLATQTGKSISLVGGTVISTGTIRTQGGNITIATVPGSKLVRVSNDGTLLALDLPIATKNQIDANAAAFTPLSLPALLTSSADIQQITANRVTVTGNVVRLVGDTRSISSGDIVTTSLNSSGVADNNGLLSNGGNISLRTQTGNIVTADLQTLGGLRGGNVSLATQTGDISIGWIDTSSNNFGGTGGDGGALTVNAGGLFRVTGFNPISNLSIFTGGNRDFSVAEVLRGGKIDITHQGTSFVVGGNTSVSTGQGGGNTVTLIDPFSFPEGASGTRGGILSRNTNGVFQVVFNNSNVGFDPSSSFSTTGFQINAVARPTTDGGTGGTGGTAGTGGTGGTAGTGNGNANNAANTQPETQIAKQKSGSNCDRSANSGSFDATNSTTENRNTSAVDPCQPTFSNGGILQILNRKN
jgi:filamentous hemagglutinin family protein